MDPIRVSVIFDSTGQPSLQRGADGILRLGEAIRRLGPNAAGSGRMMRLLQNDMDRFTESANRARRIALDGLTLGVDRLSGSLQRLSRFGMYAAIAQIAGLAYALRGLGKEFIRINEEFAGLEITMRSAFGSARIARDIRAQIAGITATSPIPFKDLAESVRAASLIKPFQQQIARDSVTGNSKSPDAFLRKFIGLVEMMITFRPDKTAEDATYAIREAAAGEFRSLARRFDIPPSLMVQASGKSLPSLRKDALSSFDAMRSMFGDIISPQAIKEITMQPTVLFQNLMEQLMDMPLLKTGEAGFYNHFLKFFREVFEDATKFVEANGNKYGKLFSEALTKLFDTTTKEVSSVWNSLLGLFDEGSSDRPGISVYERSFSAIGKALDAVTEKLPKAIVAVKDIFEVVWPILRDIGKIIGNVVDSLRSAFNNPILRGIKDFAIDNPMLTAATLLVTHTMPSLIKAGFSGILNAFLGGMQDMRSAFYRNMAGGPNYGHAAAGSGFNGPGGFRGHGPTGGAGGGAFTGATGAPPLGYRVGNRTGVIGGNGGLLAAQAAQNLAANQRLLASQGFAPGTGANAHIWTRGLGAMQQRVSMYGPRAGVPFGSGLQGQLHSVSPQLIQSPPTGGMVPLFGRGHLPGGGGIPPAGFNRLPGSPLASAAGALGSGIAGLVTGTIIPALATAGAIALLSSVVSLLVGSWKERKSAQVKGSAFKTGFDEDTSSYINERLKSFGVAVGEVREMKKLGKLKDDAFSWAIPSFSRFSEKDFPQPATWTWRQEAARKKLAEESEGKFNTGINGSGMPMVKAVNTPEAALEYVTKAAADVKAIQEAMTAGKSPADIALQAHPDVELKSIEDAVTASKMLQSSIDIIISKLGTDFKELGVVLKKYVSPEDVQYIRDLTGRFKDAMSPASLNDPETGGFAEILKDTTGQFVAAQNWLNAYAALHGRMDVLRKNEISTEALSAATDALNKLEREERPDLGRYQGGADAMLATIDAIREERATLADLRRQLESHGSYDLLMELNSNNSVNKEVALFMAEQEKYGEHGKQLASDYRKALKDNDGLALAATIQKAMDDTDQRLFGIITRNVGDNLLEFAGKGLPDAIDKLLTAKTPSEAQHIVEKELGGRVTELNKFLTNSASMSQESNAFADLLGTFQSAMAAAQKLGIGKTENGGNNYSADSARFASMKAALETLKTGADAYLANEPDKTASAEVINAFESNKEGMKGISRMVTSFVREINGYIEKATDAGYAFTRQLDLDNLRVLSAGAERYLSFSKSGGAAGDLLNGKDQASYAELRRMLGMSEDTKAASLASRSHNFSNISSDAVAARSHAIEARLEMAERYDALVGQTKDTAKQEEFRNQAIQLREVAASLELVNRELLGAGDAWSSFREGFVSVMDDFHVQARNFTSLGKEMANSLSNGLGNAFSDIALGTEKASQAFANFGKSMLQTATQMMMQKAVQMLLGSVFGGVGGLFSGFVTSSATSGGSVPPRGGFASGGLLAGPPSSKDNLLIQAATGEYVLRASAVQKFGAAHFDAYNRGELPASVRGYATGGVVGSPMMPATSSGKSGVNVSVTVNVQKDGATTSNVESSDGAEKFGANLAAFVQNQILLSKRQGGQLARAR
jgi:lambda family phage tail tape measure protein